MCSLGDTALKCLHTSLPLFNSTMRYTSPRKVQFLLWNCNIYGYQSFTDQCYLTMDSSIQTWSNLTKSVKNTGWNKFLMHGCHFCSTCIDIRIWVIVLLIARELKQTPKRKLDLTLVCFHLGCEAVSQLTAYDIWWFYLSTIKSWKNSSYLHKFAYFLTSPHCFIPCLDTDVY